MLQINWSNQLTKKRDNSVRLLKVCKICGKILIAVFLELRFVMHWKQKIHFLLLSFEKKFKKKIKLKFTSHKRKLNWLWAFWKYLTGLNFKNDCNSTFCHQRKWSEVLFIFFVLVCLGFFQLHKPASPPTDVHSKFELKKRFFPKSNFEREVLF